MIVVFVLNMHGNPLMPCSPRKARLLLKEKKAKVIRRTPFTIKLLVPSSGYKQEVVGGMDSGGKTIGSAAVANGKVVYQAETILRGDEIKRKMEQRRMYRRNRRGRKTRYRKPRFLNRGNSIKKGRIPPSVLHKIQAHEREKRFMESILPISQWKVETASFDIHQLSSDKTLDNQDYQNGRQNGFYNIKAFVLHRDEYKCACCKGKCSEKLHVHHIVFRSNGGSDKPENLITLCEKHHKELHDGKLGDFLKLEKTFSKNAQKKVKNSTHIGIISSHIRKNWEFIETFGYETKFKREKLGLSKTHYNDAIAICLKDNESIPILLEVVLRKRCVSQGDYQHTSGSRSEKRVPTGKLFGVRKFDLIKTDKGVGFVKGKRTTGYFVISDIDCLPIHNSVNVKKGMIRMSARKTVIMCISVSQFLPGTKDPRVSLMEGL